MQPPTTIITLVVIITPLALGTIIALIYTFIALRRANRSAAEAERRIQANVALRRLHRHRRNNQRADLENQLDTLFPSPYGSGSGVPLRFNFNPARPQRAHLAGTPRPKPAPSSRYQSRPRGRLNVIDEEMTEIDLGDLTVTIER